MTPPLISVIIPVYGVEKYLDRCVESVVNQTYKNLEIILVDDGSPDNCPQMCDDWALRDARIHTVHRENGGQSCARNTGLSVATGDYVTFIDSDDWIVGDTYEYCVSLLNKFKGVDVVEFGLTHVYPNKQFSVDGKEALDVYEGKNILEYYMESSTRNGSYSVCRCLFEAPTAKRYRFREGRIHEDIDYKYKVLRDCKKMIVSNQIKYCYWQEGNSTSTGALKKKDFQLYEAGEELYNLTKDEAYGKIAYYGKVKKARTAFSLLCKMVIWGIGNNELSEKEIYPPLVKELRKNLPLLLSAPIGLKRKMVMLSLSINYKITKAFIAMIGDKIKV